MERNLLNGERNYIVVRETINFFQDTTTKDFHYTY